jgi:hypothetical protein
VATLVVISVLPCLSMATVSCISRKTYLVQTISNLSWFTVVLPKDSIAQMPVFCLRAPAFQSPYRKIRRYFSEIGSDSFFTHPEIHLSLTPIVNPHDVNLNSVDHVTIVSSLLLL